MWWRQIRDDCAVLLMTRILTFIIVIVIIIIIITFAMSTLIITIIVTRSYAALRAADLGCIVRPGYNMGRVHFGEKP